MMPAEEAKPPQAADTPPSAAANPFGQELNFVDASAETGGLTELDTGAVTSGSRGETAKACIMSTIGSITEFRTKTLKTIRPWSEFGNYKELSAPSRGEMISRITANTRYYYSNYLCVIAVITAWTALHNLFFVVSMGTTMMAYSYYKHQTKDGGQCVLFGKPIPAVQFYVALAGSAVLLFWASGGSSIVFWLLASAIGIIGGHASFRQPVDATRLAQIALEEATDESVGATFASAFGSEV